MLADNLQRDIAMEALQKGEYVVGPFEAHEPLLLQPTHQVKQRKQH